MEPTNQKPVTAMSRLSLPSLHAAGDSHSCDCVTRRVLLRRARDRRRPGRERAGVTPALAQSLRVPPWRRRRRRARRRPRRAGVRVRGAEQRRPPLPGPGPEPPPRRRRRARARDGCQGRRRLAGERGGVAQRGRRRRARGAPASSGGVESALAASVACGVFLFRQAPPPASGGCGAAGGRVLSGRRRQRVSPARRVGRPGFRRRLGGRVGRVVRRSRRG